MTISLDVINGAIHHDVEAIDSEYQVAKADAIARLRNIDGKLRLIDGDLADGSYVAYPEGSLPEKTETVSPPAPPVDPPVNADGSGAGGEAQTPLADGGTPTGDEDLTVVDDDLDETVHDVY